MTFYAIQRHENKEMFTIHLSVKVPRISWLGSKDDPAEGKALKEEIEKIAGVEEVTAHHHQVRVKRGGAFTVEQIAPAVLRVLQEKLGLGGTLKEVEPFA